MANISQIKLPNGDTHNFIDTASGYTKNTGTITSVKTTAGTHSAINVSSGAANFNVPTKTSHLTNDSGFKTTDTNTTYTLSGALSSHKFTSTLTAGGSGSGTSTSEIAFAAGTGITLTDDATNKKITIAASHNGTVTSVAASGSGGITISGSPITSSGTITIGLNLSTAINGLSEGTAPAQLNDYAVVQYAGGGTTTTSYHRRKLTNLIVGKAVADQNGDTINTTYLKLIGGNVTGPVNFGDTVSIDDLNAGQLVVSGSASIANNLQVNTINGVAVGSSPKFTDTVTTATTTGSGNAVTAITASNGALTVTKGTTFLTSHNTYTVSTTGSGNAVTAVSLSGTTFTVTKGATYSNNAGTITSVKTTAGAHTAINTTSGAVTFNVPTTAAHVGIKFGYTTSGNNRAVLQDSSGNLYVTQKDTNTDISTLTLAEDTGTSAITLAHGGKYKLTAGTKTVIFTMPASGNTDTKVAITAVTPASETTNYVLTHTSTSGTTGVEAHAYNKYWYKQGSTSVNGYVYASLGNNIATGTANNSQGYVRLYGPNTGYGNITYANATANSTHTLPSTGGTILNTGTTSFTQSLTSGTKVGTIKINGTETILYAPTNTNTTYSAGTGLSLSSTTFSVKLGYTTSGNNRAVQADSNGNLYVTQKDDNTTYSSKAAASGGTDVSLVTTGEKYTWNSKTSNTGTITSVKTTAGAHTAINVTSGAANFNVPTTAAHVGIKFGYTTSGNNRAVLQDSSGNLYVTQKDTTYSSMTAAEITAGNGTTARLITPANLKTAIETWSKRDIIQAAGTGTTSLAAGTITQVPLTTTLISRDTYGCFAVASNRVTISKAGIYRITGSVYINPTTATQLGVYIRMGTGTFANATEIAGSLLSGTSGAINVTKTIKVSSTQYIYLGARSYGYAGTVANSNDATYLEIEYLGN